MGNSHYAAATGTARSARGWRAPNGWRTVRPNCSTVGYFHVVFTVPDRDRRHRVPEPDRGLRYPVPGGVGDDATIAADPKHLGAEIGFLAVLHTWGSALTQHPHSGYPALSSP